MSIYRRRSLSLLALDDPIVIMLIVALVVVLFGSNKIPSVARAIGQARREFDNALKGITPPEMPPRATTPPGATNHIPSTTPAPPTDPLVLAAQKEGIDTVGKTREQISTELAWKLNKDRTN